ncbi:unnamed protein product, partial [Prorocentrum cordatum]
MPVVSELLVFDGAHAAALRRSGFGAPCPKPTRLVGRSPELAALQRLRCGGPQFDAGDVRRGRLPPPPAGLASHGRRRGALDEQGDGEDSGGAAGPPPIEGGPLGNGGICVGGGGSGEVLVRNLGNSFSAERYGMKVSIANLVDRPPARPGLLE